MDNLFKDKKQIEELFNNGITFWKNPSEVYRYDLGGSNV